MPELPEVEVTRLGLLPYLPGRKVVKITCSSKRLREPIRSGQTIYGFTAHVSAGEVRFTHEDTVCVRKLTR